MKLIDFLIKKQYNCNKIYVFGTKRLLKEVEKKYFKEG